MLYLDHARRDGEWVPNQFGGRENIDAIAFLRRLDEWAYQEFPDVMTMAEASTAWPMVSRPMYVGGLGFGFKWNMGWVHDMFQYASWRLKSDASIYGGSGQGNWGDVEARPLPAHGRPWSLRLTLPPLSNVVFQSGPHDELRA